MKLAQINRKLSSEQSGESFFISLPLEGKVPRNEADEVLDTTFLTNLFTNRKIRDIIALPNELNKRIDRYIFLYGITIPFFVILLNESIW